MKRWSSGPTSFGCHADPLGRPSSLYVKMAERLNCVQNQITLHDRVLIRNKVAGFIMIGGQDNVQAVAGQMMMFFARARFPLSAVSIHRPQPRLVGRGHGEQRCRGSGQC